MKGRYGIIPKVPPHIGSQDPRSTGLAAIKDGQLSPKECLAKPRPEMIEVIRSIAHDDAMRMINRLTPES